MSRRLLNTADHPLPIDITTLKCSNQWFQNCLSWNGKADLIMQGFEHPLPDVLPKEPDLVRQGTAGN